MLPHFISADTPLWSADAVAAILVTEEGGYVMQLRDDIPHIWYPDHWGCFGGAIEPGETPLQALERELTEELGLAFTGISPFTSFTFDFRPLGQNLCTRHFFEVKTTRSAIGLAQLGEGAEIRIVEPADLLANYRLAPYDSFGLYMHFAQNRFKAAEQQR